MTNEAAVTCDDLQDHLGSYREGLITGHDLVCLTKACVRAEPKPPLPYAIEAEPGLAVAFTPKGIQALLTRIVGSRELAEELLTGTWTVSQDGRALGTHLVTHGGLASEHDRDDYQWIMPRIEFPMPDGSIVGPSLADRHRRLTIRDGLLHFA